MIVIWTFGAFDLLIAQSGQYKRTGTLVATFVHTRRATSCDDAAIELACNCSSKIRGSIAQNDSVQSTVEYKLVAKYTDTT